MNLYYLSSANYIMSNNSVPISNGNSEKLDISTESDLILDLRKNWCCILEEILECPICLEIPGRNIYQCNKGHIICDTCRLSLNTCPVCEASYTGTRNWCMEKIVEKLEQMKDVLLDPNSNTEKCIRIKKMSQASQTDVENNSEKNKTENVNKIVYKSVRLQNKNIVNKRSNSE